jgi:hypothetical protein
LVGIAYFVWERIGAFLIAWSARALDQSGFRMDRLHTLTSLGNFPSWWRAVGKCLAESAVLRDSD